MNKVSLMDCTLRDGAYIVQAKFGAEAMRGIILKLQEAGIDIVECGWLKDTPHEEGTSFFHVPNDLQHYLVAPKRPGTTYAAMMHWDKYDLSLLPPCDGKTIDAIRVLFPQEHYKEGIALADTIRDKGYQVFFQAKNTMGYSDYELLKMLDAINEANPTSMALVDTFGAMYPEDLVRMVSLINHNLRPEIALGFHSHNNLQLSFALCMEFVKTLKDSQRKLIIDSSLCGMARGAGNVPTELMADYLIKVSGASYDMNRILDTIDTYMSYFIENFEWGYSVPYYISGALCAHVNNIAYLTKTHRTSAHDMKAILECMDSEERTQYDGDKLEKIYVDYHTHKVDDTQALQALQKNLQGKSVLLISPGETSRTQLAQIKAFIADKKPVIIGINAAFSDYPCDYLFFSNAMRLQYAREVNATLLETAQLIITSNIQESEALSNQPYMLNYNDLIKRGWKNFDNSTIICLRLLQKLNVAQITLAGFDGYSEVANNNYTDPVMQTILDLAQRKTLNEEIMSMFTDFMHGYANHKSVSFLTPSHFTQVEND